MEGFLRPRDPFALARRAAGGPAFIAVFHTTRRCENVVFSTVMRRKARGSAWIGYDRQMVLFSFPTFGADQLIFNKKNSCVPKAWSNPVDMRRRGPGPLWTAPAAVAGVIALFCLGLHAGLFIIFKKFPVCLVRHFEISQTSNYELKLLAFFHNSIT